MAQLCEICGKSYLRGNLVARGIGRRVTRRTTSHHNPNLRSKRITLGDVMVKVKICTSCLKRLKKTQSEFSPVNTAVARN